MQRFAKPLVALVAALGLLTFLAAPASATTGTITHGTITASNTTTNIVVTLGTGGTGVTCLPTTTPAITAVDSSTGALDSRTLTGTFSMIISGAFQFNGNWYELIPSPSTTSPGTITGTYTSTHTGTTSGYHLTVHVAIANYQIRETTATNPCSSTGTIKCQAISVPSLTLTSSQGNSTQAHPGPLGQFGPTSSGDTTPGSTGNANIGAFGCTAPFSTLNGHPLTITNLGVLF